MDHHDRSKRIIIAESFTESNGVIINPDITESILSRIPIEFVSRSRAVCKLWRNHLKKPKTGFLFAVLERHTDDFQIFHGYNEEVSIHEEQISHKTLTKIDLGSDQSRDIPVKLIRNHLFDPIMFGSCNGLVCFPVRKDETKCLVYICNPMTGEYIYLPETDFGKISNPKVLGGFGYSQSTNEYKVVQVTYEDEESGTMGMVQVYTLGGSGWRNKGEILFTHRERLVFTNEALYWLECIEDDWNLRFFHLADETFGTLQIPPFHDRVRDYERPNLVVSVNGSLYVYHDSVERSYHEDPKDLKEDRRLDIWILKKEQRKKNSEWYSHVDENDDSNPWVWIREITMKYKTVISDRTELSDYRFYEPFFITSNSQVLMWEDCDVHDYKIPICYDPKTASMKSLWNTRVSYAYAIPHMNSFVSLEDLGEKSARYIPEPESR